MLCFLIGWERACFFFFFLQSVVFGLSQYMSYTLLEYLGRWQLMPGSDDSPNCGLSASICPSSNFVWAIPVPLLFADHSFNQTSMRLLINCSAAYWEMTHCRLQRQTLATFSLLLGGGGVVTVVVIKISEAGNVRLLLFQSLGGLYKGGKKGHARGDAQLDPITNWQDCQAQITSQQ